MHGRAPRGMNERTLAATGTRPTKTFHPDSRQVTVTLPVAVFDRLKRRAIEERVAIAVRARWDIMSQCGKELG